MKNLEDLMVAQYENVESISNDDIFEDFYDYMKNNIKYDMDKQELIDFISQYVLLEPVFNMLFVSTNEITIRLKNIISFMKENNLIITNKELEKIYTDINKKVCNIKTQEDKQTIIIEIYNTFFKNACKDKCELHGIVFTPIEVVDFIIYSVEDVLQKHFRKSIRNESVHILDPFTGTGTFIVRLLQSGLIKKEDLLRKYTKELHANEIMLLSYYIAAINIEETYHAIIGGEYAPFKGIVLTDTFESTEREELIEDVLFYENSERLKYQQQEPIFVIISNPPYSTGQNNENENNQNKHYPILEQEITNTYARNSKAKLKQSLYDSYVKSFKWASLRIEEKGVIGFVTNGSFIDSQSTDGLRKCWYEEFNYIYLFNLRGDARTSGEQRRKEAGNVFGEGTRTTVAITLLVKDGSDNHEIYYHDIGDYLSREEKLDIISDYKSINGILWSNIVPDNNNDWINQRDEKYENYIPMDNELENSIFKNRSIGISTNRDMWVYGFSRNKVKENTEYMVENYNSEVRRLKGKTDTQKLNEMNTADNFIKWTDGLKKALIAERIISVDEKYLQLSYYRPFTKKWLYFDKTVIHRPRKYHDIMSINNEIIFTSGAGAKRDFSVIMVDLIPNQDMNEKGQGFYLNSPQEVGISFENEKLNINKKIAQQFQLNQKDLFYYTYGVLHSSAYREKYANNLRKSLPHIPILKNKEKYIEVGRQLANLHLNYESVPPYEGVEVIYKTSNPSYKVTKMKHPRRGVLDTIVFNHDITITNIPEKAYEYIVNGKSAIEWIIDQYQVKTDKKSCITDDPNLYSENEKYIFNLLLSIINVSVQTVDLVNSLPPLEIEE